MIDGGYYYIRIEEAEKAEILIDFLSNIGFRTQDFDLSISEEFIDGCNMIRIFKNSEHKTVLFYKYDPYFQSCQGEKNVLSAGGFVKNNLV